jgi:hypothetical protein
LATAILNVPSLCHEALDDTMELMILEVEFDAFSTNAFLACQKNQACIRLRSCIKQTNNK